MKAIYSFLFLLFFSSVLFGQQNNPTFFKGVKNSKSLSYYALMENDWVRIFEVKEISHKVIYPLVTATDTLLKVSATTFKGRSYTLQQENESLLITPKNKKIRLIAAENTDTIRKELNEAYYMKSHFALSKKLNTQFPLYDYSYYNGSQKWEKLTTKGENIDKFKEMIDIEMSRLYDSISTEQTKWANITNTIMKNISEDNYTIIKDNLALLPHKERSEEYRSSYFTTAVLEVAKAKPEYFFRLIEDFPTHQEAIIGAVRYDRKVVAALKRVEGHDKSKKIFLKDLKEGRFMLYRGIGMYAIAGGLITWLIVMAQR